MNRKNYISAICVALVAYQALAFDFSAADTQWKNREENKSAIKSAKIVYKKALRANDTSAKEKIYAAEKLGQLAYYEGDLLLDEDAHDARMSFFDDCMEDMDQVSPEKVGENVTYYFYKAMCLAFWGKSKNEQFLGGVAVAMRVGELKDLITKALKLDASYQGGGAHRLYAGVYIKSKVLGVYDLEGALKHINQAIAVDASYTNAFLIKADVLLEMGKHDEALQLLNQQHRLLKQKVEANDLPEHYAPESKIILKRMQDKMNKM